jgi:hypothetical protein
MSKRVRVGLTLVLLSIAGCSSATASPSAEGDAKSDAKPTVVAPPSGPGQLEPLARRTAGPVVLRTYQQNAVGSPDACDRYSQSCPPPWCAVTGLLVTELSTEAVATDRRAGIVGLAPGSVISLLGGPGEGRSIEWYPDDRVGVAEGAPVQLQTVRVAPEVAIVQLSTPDGVDSVAPTNGLAALAVAGPATSGRIAALGADGRELGRIELPAASTASSAVCRPVPPQAPRPGEQPADVTTAEQQVRAAFSTAFTHAPASDRYRALVAVERGDSLRPAIDDLRRSFEQVAETVTVSTDQVVFTDPTTAVVRYTLSYSGGAAYGTRYGQAVLTDGRWLVTRDTWCAPLGYAGVTCPG